MKKESEAQRSRKTEVKEAADVFSVTIDKDNEELTSIYKTKDATREEHFKALYEYEVQSDFIRWASNLRA